MLARPMAWAVPVAPEKPLLNRVVSEKPLAGWWQVAHATVLFTLRRLSQNSTRPSVAPLSVMRLLGGVLSLRSSCAS